MLEKLRGGPLEESFQLVSALQLGHPPGAVDCGHPRLHDLFSLVLDGVHVGTESESPLLDP